MTVASDGAIWLVEDHNKTIIRIDSEPSQPADTLPCDLRSQPAIDELVKFVQADPSNSKRLTAIRTGLIEKHCVSCHSGFGLKPGLAEKDKDETVLRFVAAQDGWIYPGRPHIRPAAYPPQRNRGRADHAAGPAGRPRSDGA